jgi:peptidyl-prolyl cis-trans isomerase SurA
VSGGRGRLLWALLLVAVAAPLRGQQVPELVDRVVAVVGNQPILLSDVQEHILIQQAQSGLQLPPDSASRMALRRQMLQTMTDDEVLYQAARKDTSITVTDADVLSQVSQTVQSVRNQYPSETALRAELAKIGFGSVEEWRRWLTEQQRRTDYQQKYLSKLDNEGKMPHVNVTLDDLHEAFTQWQQTEGTTNKRPATVSFEQIVIAPQPTAAAKAAALARADSILDQLHHGGDFAALARRYSDDPGTRDLGGELGWVRRGTMVDAFERVAFSMRPGEISNPIETGYGYHIIKVEKVQPAEVQASHILITPAIDSVNLHLAAARADSVAAALRAGANFDSLARRYADTTEQAHVDSVPRSRLPPLYAAAFDTAKVGQVIPPFAVNTENSNRTKFVVAILTDTEAERDYTFSDLRDQLRGQVARQKSLQELLRRLRSQTYVSESL